MGNVAVGGVGWPWIIHGLTDELICECASVFLKSSMVSYVWIGVYVHTKSLGVATGLANAWFRGLAKFANAPPRDRVCSIIVVPSLLNGSCFKKSGSVAQKYKLIQWVNAPQLPGENGCTWNWLMLKLMGPKMIEVKAPVQIIFFWVGSLRGGGVLPHISHMSMSHPEGYGFYTFSGGVFETKTPKTLKTPYQMTLNFID